MTVIEFLGNRCQGGEGGQGVERWGCSYGLSIITRRSISPFFLTSKAKRPPWDIWDTWNTWESWDRRDMNVVSSLAGLASLGRPWPQRGRPAMPSPRTTKEKFSRETVPWTDPWTSPSSRRLPESPDAVHLQPIFGRRVSAKLKGA